MIQLEKWTYLQFIKNNSYLNCCFHTHHQHKILSPTKKLKEKKLWKRSDNLMTKFLENILDTQQLPILTLKKTKNIEDFKILIREDNQQIEIIFMQTLPQENTKS